MSSTDYTRIGSPQTCGRNCGYTYYAQTIHVNK